MALKPVLHHNVGNIRYVLKNDDLANLPAIFKIMIFFHLIDVFSWM